MDFNSSIFIKTDPNQSPIRIDKFLVDKIPTTTRNKIQNLISQGFVTINDKIIKSNFKIKPNISINIKFPFTRHKFKLTPEKIDLDIFYEDNYLLVVNKPAGMVVHPGYNNWSNTLANALAYHYNDLPTKEDPERPGIIHRIDKDTSGLLVVSKDEFTMHKLAKQFYDHSIERKYLALVWGTFAEKEGTIDEFLKKSPRDRRIVTVTKDPSNAKRSITHYKVLKNFRYTSLIECKLETGRTHQIRSHMKYKGHPIFNDNTYGGDLILKGPIFSKYKAFVKNCFKIMPTMALHAKSLGFTHPMTNKYLYFESDISEPFQNLINKWDSYSKLMSKIML